MNKNIGIAFSKDNPQDDPFSGMGAKKPVYEELFKLLIDQGFNVFVVNINKYLGNGFFEIDNKKVKMDLVYDRSGGLKFPLNDDNLTVIDNYDFKMLAWNKWEAYKLLGKYMPKTVLLENINKLKTEKIVVKPINGLKGMDIFIGDLDAYKNYKLNSKKVYIAQEFVDTSSGIKGITNGNHDLRLVIINKKIVWSHVRTPAVGSLKANVAGGGNLKEIEVKNLPENIIKISNEIGELFYEKFYNPLFSLDYGFDKFGKPYIFEINDQIGFPLPTMIAKDLFLKELVANFTSKL